MKPLFVVAALVAVVSACGAPIEEDEVSAAVVVDQDPDRDGLTGANDLCPTVSGPKENQGCPDLDTDKDTIPDKDDKCPYEPGPKETQGCPPPHKY